MSLSHLWLGLLLLLLLLGVEHLRLEGCDEAQPPGVRRQRRQQDLQISFLEG